MASTETPLVPDVDGLCAVATHLSEPTLFRLRVWTGEQVALVEDAPANVGMSVTNAIEHVGSFVECNLGVRLAPHPEAEWAGWQLVQHNPKASVHRLDLVAFAARDRHSGALALPRWTPVPAGLMEWLFAVVAG